MLIVPLRLVTHGAVAGCHGREMAEGNVRVSGRHRGEDVLCLGIQGALAIVHQQAKCGAGEDLGEGPNAVHLVYVVAVPDHPAVPDDDEFVNAVAADGSLEQ